MSDKQIIVDRLENDGKVVSKTYKTADENIATGLAKDDFVVITHNLYKDNLDIVKADKATGTVDATKGPNSGYTDYQIDGTWYVAADNRDEINAAVKAGTKVDYVAVNGVLFYAEKATSTSDKLDDILFVAYVGQDGLSNEQARVMFPDGKKDTINLKDTSYDSDLNGSKNAAIVGGQFYEFNKSNNEYELLPVREYDPNGTTAVANKDHEDYYGAFTYYGTENLTFDGNGAPATVDNVGKIDDNADVIVYQTQDKDGNYTDGDTENGSKPMTKAVVKHITGKQLKSNKAILSSSSVVTATNGAFQSEVKGFDRASVLAVTYKGEWNSLENLTANANYGYIVKDAEKVAGGIKFDMITADDKEAITVFADESSTTNFDKGAVVGYSSITEATAPAGDEKLPVVNDLSFIAAGDGTDGIKATYISETNGTDKVSVPGKAEMDLDDFTTVIYTKTYAGEIEKNANGAPAVAKDKRTNILYVGTEVAIIDANQIGGDVYAKNNITVEKFDDSASIEWTDATTGETWKGDVRDAYNNAVLNLSVTAKKDGKITLTVGGESEVRDVVANKACKVDGIKVTGNVVLTWGDASGDPTVDETNVVDVLNNSAVKNETMLDGSKPTVSASYDSDFNQANVMVCGVQVSGEQSASGTTINLTNGKKMQIQSVEINSTDFSIVNNGGGAVTVTWTKAADATSDTVANATVKAIVIVDGKQVPVTYSIEVTALSKANVAMYAAVNEIAGAANKAITGTTAGSAVTVNASAIDAAYGTSLSTGGATAAVKSEASEYLTFDGTDLKVVADEDLPAQPSKEKVTVTLTGADGREVNVEIQVEVPASKTKALVAGAKAIQEVMKGEFTFGDVNWDAVASGTPVNMTATLTDAAKADKYFENGKLYGFKDIVSSTGISKDVNASGTGDAAVTVENSIGTTDKANVLIKSTSTNKGAFSSDMKLTFNIGDSDAVVVTLVGTITHS